VCGDPRPSSRTNAASTSTAARQPILTIGAA
jgi:hypothetical protein